MKPGSIKTVLYVVDGLGLSGKTRTLAYVASHLDPRRFRPVICTLTAEPSPLTEQLRESGVDVQVVPCRDGVNLATILHLRRVMRAVGADIVHCYNLRPILYGGIAAKLAGVRGTIGFLSAFACQVPDRDYGFLPQPLTTTSRRNVYRNRLAARLMQHLVTVSPSLGARFCAYNAIPPDKLRVVPYGADLTSIDRTTADEALALRRELGFGDDDVVIGSVGRLVEQKDYPTQLRAFALASKHAPRLRMIIAGAGPLDPDLRQMAHALGVHRQVHFLGHCDRVPCLLRSLDIFVLASKFEPFGVALLEAKAAGLPIVATRVNEIPEIVEHGVTGLLSAPEDPEAMSELFVRLSADPVLRRSLGASARNDAREKHGLDASVAAYQNLYVRCA